MSIQTEEMINYLIQIAKDNEELTRKTLASEFTTAQDRIDNGLFGVNVISPREMIMDAPPIQTRYEGVISLEQGTTDEAIVKYKNEKTIALIFVNANGPGLYYLKGTMGQEETIFRQYPYLCRSLENREVRYNPMEASMLSENIPRHRDENLVLNLDPQIYGNFICVAGSNFRSVIDYNQDLSPYKKSIEFYVNLIFAVPLSKGYDILIVGAWGCGFCAPPGESNIIHHVTEIAKMMKKYAQKYKDCYKKIVFQIPKDKNYDIFEEIINS
jgi:uncharacterized protein (TIGR02452 family)